MRDRTKVTISIIIFAVFLVFLSFFLMNHYYSVSHNDQHEQAEETKSSPSESQTKANNTKQNSKTNKGTFFQDKNNPDRFIAVNPSGSKGVYMYRRQANGNIYPEQKLFNGKISTKNGKTEIKPTKKSHSSTNKGFSFKKTGDFTFSDKTTGEKYEKVKITKPQKTSSKQSSSNQKDNPIGKTAMPNSSKSPSNTGVPKLNPSSGSTDASTKNHSVTVAPQKNTNTQPTISSDHILPPTSMPQTGGEGLKKSIIYLSNHEFFDPKTNTYYGDHPEAFDPNNYSEISDLIFDPSLESNFTDDDINSAIEAHEDLYAQEMRDWNIAKKKSTHIDISEEDEKNFDLLEPLVGNLIYLSNGDFYNETTHVYYGDHPDTFDPNNYQAEKLIDPDYDPRSGTLFIGESITKEQADHLDDYTDEEIRNMGALEITIQEHHILNDWRKKEAHPTTILVAKSDQGTDSDDGESSSNDKNPETDTDNGDSNTDSTDPDNSGDDGANTTDHDTPEDPQDKAEAAINEFKKTAIISEEPGTYNPLNLPLTSDIPTIPAQNGANVYGLIFTGSMEFYDTVTNTFYGQYPEYFDVNNIHPYENVDPNFDPRYMAVQTEHQIDPKVLRIIDNSLSDPQIKALGLSYETRVKIREVNSWLDWKDHATKLKVDGDSQTIENAPQ